METAGQLLAGVIFVGWLLYLLDAARGYSGLSFVRRLPMPTGDELAALPRVSIVVAARNEQRAVERAIRSMLALQYPALEIVAIDDRSEDRTGAMLAGLAAADPRLHLLRVDELPEGWLGKTHALARGAALADGELLLFTDADVVFEPTILARVVAMMVERELDHVAAPADIEAPSLGLELFVATFALFFNGYFRPWRASDPRSKRAIGFGAFNLVRADAYARAGGHAAVAMEPLDDVRLGEVLKASGARQRCAIPGCFLTVEWYPSLRAAFVGLEKNTLAAVNYSLPLLIVGGMAQTTFTAWPFLAVLVMDGPARWLYVGTVVLIIVIQLGALSESRLRAWTAFAVPVGVLLVQFAYARAAWITLRRGGIEWRGTFHSLAEMRAARRRSR